MELNRTRTILKEKGVTHILKAGIKVGYFNIRYFVDLSAGYVIHEIPLFSNTKREFYRYYKWPGLPSQEYTVVPPELEDKYCEFMSFGRIKRWLLYCWKMYVAKKIGDGKLDGKALWIEESGKDKHLWNLANFRGYKIKYGRSFCNFFIKLLKESKPKKVLEIGCGCGCWLDYFRDFYSGCGYHGYDIDEEIIKFDVAYYQGKTNLFFHSGSLDDTLSKVKPDIVFFCGTAEFIPQDELSEIIKSIGKQGVKGIVFNEPITLPFDFKNDWKSRKRGKIADAFNHNYPYLLEMEGYNTKYFKKFIPYKAKKLGIKLDVRECVVLGELSGRPKKTD